MDNGLIVQKLAVGENKLVRDLRLQKHPKEDRNAKERLQRQIPVIITRVQSTAYGVIMENGLTAQKRVRRLVLDLRL